MHFCSSVAVLGQILPIRTNFEIFDEARCNPGQVDGASVRTKGAFSGSELLYHSPGSCAGAGRTFELKIVTKSGPEHNYASINRDKHEITEKYLMDIIVRYADELVYLK